jgi:peptidoglycan hydrolase-like protein with peptidoglycan-binding domain
MRLMLAPLAVAAALFAVPAMAQSTQTVRAAQEALKSKGFDPGPIDGINGPLTHKATREYQEHEHLTANGQLSSATLDSLQINEKTMGGNFHEAGGTLANSYASGGHDVAKGSKQLGKQVAHGDVGQGAEDFGKGVGNGAKKVGVGTAHAAKDAAKGVKDAVENH